MPGTRCDGQNATCSVSAKKLSGQRSSTMRPTTRSGTSSSGMSLVASRWSKGKRVRFFFGEELHCEIPLGQRAGADRLEQIAPVKVGIGAGDLHRLVPDRRLHAELRPPVKLHEGRGAVVVDEAKAVDAEAFHHAQRPRKRAIRHDPHHHVHRLGRQRDEVPERVVRGRRLRKAPVGLHLHGVDEIGELDRVLDEEDRNVVADEIPVALLGVELDGEAAHVARRVDRAGAAGHGREPGEDRRPLADLGQDLGGRVRSTATR